MSNFDDDINRGYLENGEPLEALYGVGWWTPRPEPEPEYYEDACPYCKQEAWFYMGEFCDCPKCGKTYEDVSEDE